jgi:hypothetical protein
MNYSEVINAIPSPNGKERVISKRQDTEDIIDEIVFCFKSYNKQAAKVSDIIRTGDVKTDSKSIYDFIRHNIEYIAEPENDQTVRSFSRIIHDKQGDCKHSALIVASLGWNMGYDVIFRFVSYVKGESYGHVYALLSDPKTGQVIIVDPLQKFNSEKDYVKKVDYIAKQKNSKMTLSRLTGIEDLPTHNAPIISGSHHKHNKGCAPQHKHGHKHKKMFEMPETHVQVNGIGYTFTSTHDEMSGIGRRTRAQRKAARSSRRTARKARRKERGGALRMIALTPVRAAFTSLILINALGFASKMQNVINTNESEAKAFAKKLGYRYNIFKSQVGRGSRKHRLGNISGMVEINGIGIAIPVLLATAAPAVILAVALFKKMGLVDPKEAAAIDAGVGVASGALQSQGISPAEVQSGGGGGGGGAQSFPQGGGEAPAESAAEKLEAGERDVAQSEGGLMSQKIMGVPAPVLLIVGSALAAWLAFGKKK